MVHTSQVYLLDYGAGNVRSVINAVETQGFQLKYIQSVEDFDKADKIIFPGVGAFASCMAKLEALGYVEPLRKYIASGRPFFGVCLGMQTLFEASEEGEGLIKGLGVVPSVISKFEVPGLAVPHMGWNVATVCKPNPILPHDQERYYFVHSFKAMPTETMRDWVMTTTTYGVEFVSSIFLNNVMATQFHPEKSGTAGLHIFRRFLELPDLITAPAYPLADPAVGSKAGLAPRVIACLDVRANDAGDLVVTKGDQYDVREKDDAGDVRNLGKPVELAKRYYEEGADEVTFLNITSFRNSPLKDQPMLEVLRQTSREVFVPLTIGGGIKDIVDPDGTARSALQVADEYFRSGADKVSIGSDAVLIAEAYIASGMQTGKSSIETISAVYGSQAVVISVDPTRVYVQSPSDVKHHTIKTSVPGPNGESYCWYQCTIKGGRERRDLGAYELVRACEALGAGEILLNCMDKDGTNSGYDHELISDIKKAVGIPVIASSGAGRVEHFSACLRECQPDAVLAAGIFHRQEVPIAAVKTHLQEQGFAVRGAALSA
ncbi:uncharacterized protein MONBRDRAFT_16620 [Monosiga brevicollis MX1]|uniref:Imidazole glycerol phosphate synthase hisHF n=1 Tax=Monosiga brevicollis TaxID=81824 RepID=A9UYA3_MONBE|nr:uncharacterized protein MONBRDRAFT_16620 [Monosiga brevicollis MX1]EDQ89824.1 predicted protein [Monosiga brevicollis MX1]|eukprot:XP_001745246.1 hypothetical protein [Monosiga brevicollis MX1]